MALRLRRVKRMLGFKENRTERYLVRPDRATPVTFGDYCKQTVLISGVNEAQVRATMIGAAGALQMFINQGHAVSIDGIGTFIPTISAKSSTVEGEANVGSVVKRKLRFIPDAELKRVIEDMTLEFDVADSTNDSETVPSEPEEDEPVVQ